MSAVHTGVGLATGTASALAAHLASLENSQYNELARAIMVASPAISTVVAWLWARLNLIITDYFVRLRKKKHIEKAIFLVDTEMDKNETSRRRKADLRLIRDSLFDELIKETSSGAFFRLPTIPPNHGIDTKSM